MLEVTSKNPSRVEGDIVWIELTRGLRACVDLGDWPKVAGLRWCAQRGRNYPYAYNNSVGYMHCFLMGRVGIDHRDRDGLNNRRENLRAASNVLNGRNRKKQNCTSSRFKGACWEARRKKWHSSLTSEGRTHFLGYYKYEVDAAKAYDEKAKELFGEFARLNFPEAK